MAARTWRRGSTLIASAVGISLALAACSDGGESGDDASAGGEGAAAGCEEFADYGTFDGEAVEIYSPIRDVEADLFTEVLTPFAECTNIDVTWEGSGEFEAQLRVRVQGGNAPQLATFPQPGLLQELAASGDLLPASEEVAAIAEENYPEDWRNYATVDGEFYGAPLGANVKSFVWYSPSYFADNGYEIPETWEDMLALSDEIAASGIKPWCVGIESGDATGWVATDWFEDVILRANGTDTYDQWVSHEIPFDDPAIAEAAAVVENVIKNEDYVNGGLGDVQSITITAFQDGGLPILSGECAMHRQASFYANQWPEGTTVAEDGDVFAFYLPNFEGNEESPVLGGGEFVAKFSDDPATDAVQQYMASAEFANAKAALGNWISPNLGLDVSVVENPIDQLSVEILQDEAAVFRFDGSDSMPGAVGAGSFWTNATDWINGTITTDEMLANIEASWPSE